jgi:hypothetical protein
MKYTIEMSSDAMVYIPSFVKIDSGIQELMGGGGNTGTQTARKSRKSNIRK